MRRAIVSLVLIGFICSASACDDSSPESPASSQSSEASLPAAKKPPTSKEDSTRNATTAIENWIKLVDQGQYETCYEQTGAWLKQEVPKKDTWIKQITATRAAFGPLISRKVKNVEYKTNPLRMPPGVYVNITYDSSFANVKDAFEEVGATFDDGKWQPLGYYVGAKPQPTSTPKK